VNPVFGREGWKALAPSWALLAATLIAGAGIVVGSLWLLEREKRGSLDSGRRLQEARARVDEARRERANLQDSSETFRTLVDRGLLQTERRLDLVELVNELRTAHRLYALDYEVGTQRPLKLGTGRAYGAVDVLASRVRIKARALHEGDLVGFIEGLTVSRQGFYPVDRCQMRRVDAGLAPDALQPRIEAECTLEWITLKDKRGNRGG
jgi:hypothetical protein